MELGIFLFLVNDKWIFLGNGAFKKLFNVSVTLSSFERFHRFRKNVYLHLSYLCWKKQMSFFTNMIYYQKQIWDLNYWKTFSFFYTIFCNNFFTFSMLLANGHFTLYTISSTRISMLLANGHFTLYTVSSTSIYIFMWKFLS